MKKQAFFLILLSLVLLGGCVRSSDSSDSDETSEFCVDETYLPWFPGEKPGGYQPTDPLFIYQWHLKNFGQQAGPYKAQKSGEDLNVTAVWDPNDLNTTGRGVTIAVVDSGVDMMHGDLLSRMIEKYSWNYSTTDNDPTPVGSSEYCAHGTAVAGIAAASANGMGVSGVAPGAFLAGLNVGLSCGFGASELQYADALQPLNSSDRGPLDIDIFTNSWGLSEPSVGGISQEERDAIEEGVQTGRGGKGAIYLFASGNSRESDHDSNYFSEQNSFYTISVAALNSDGCYASYSNPGASLLVSAYGGAQGSEESPTIMTTDLAGCDRGYNASGAMPHRLNATGDYTHWMNGTSAATPMVAGVVALMLEANEALTWRDVRYILATTARKNCFDDSGADWSENGAGHWVSHDYGFGAVDAHSAVSKAKSFSGLGGYASESFTGSDFSTVDSNTLAATVSVGPDRLVEFVDLNITIEDSDKGIGPMITLIAPSNTRSILSSGGFLFEKGFFDQGWGFGSTRHLDERSSGEWRLEIAGVAAERLKEWSLTLYTREAP